VYQLYRYDMASGNITLLTDGKIAEPRRTVVVERRSGRVHVHAATNKDTDLWVMNPSDPKTDHC